MSDEKLILRPVQPKPDATMEALETALERAIRRAQEPPPDPLQAAKAALIAATGSVLDENSSLGPEWQDVGGGERRPSDAREQLRDYRGGVDEWQDTISPDLK
jgi:hypothetical protein